MAQGIWLSPALTEQSSAASFLDTLAQLTNAGLVWSGGTLKVIPYADTPLSNNGYKVQLAKVAMKRAILRAAGLETGGF